MGLVMLKQEKTNIEEKENEAKKLKNENEYKANNTPSSERKTGTKSTLLVGI